MDHRRRDLEFLPLGDAAGVLDSFALGALIAIWRKSGAAVPFTRGWLGAVCGLAALGCYIAARLVRFGPFGGPWVAIIETLENVFLGWLLLRTAMGWRGLGAWLFENPILVSLGKISYGLYVFHVLVHVAIGPWLDHHGLLTGDHSLARSAVLMALSIGLPRCLITTSSSRSPRGCAGARPPRPVRRDRWQVRRPERLQLDKPPGEG